MHRRKCPCLSVVPEPFGRVAKRRRCADANLLSGRHRRIQKELRGCARLYAHRATSTTKVGSMVRWDRGSKNMCISGPGEQEHGLIRVHVQVNLGVRFKLKDRHGRRMKGFDGSGGAVDGAGRDAQ